MNGTIGLRNKYYHLPAIVGYCPVKLSVLRTAIENKLDIIQAKIARLPTQVDLTRVKRIKILAQEAVVQVPLRHAPVMPHRRLPNHLGGRVDSS